MKCELCGKQYIALGVHLRHKHAVDPDDYREEFGILRTTPLVDADLSEHLSVCQSRAMRDPDYKAAAAQRCRDNAKALAAGPAPVMTKAGRAALAARNAAANAEYLKQRAPDVAKVLREKRTLSDVRKALGTSAKAALKMAAMMGVEYTTKSAKEERDRRASATARAKAMAKVEKVMEHFATTQSAAEMCRRGGISTTTYKNWVRAGLMPRHQRGISSADT